MNIVDTFFNLNSTLKESVRGQKSDTERKRSRE